MIYQMDTFTAEQAFQFANDHTAMKPLGLNKVVRKARCVSTERDMLLYGKWMGRALA
jgi:hypothetical protein